MYLYFVLATAVVRVSVLDLSSLVFFFSARIYRLSHRFFSRNKIKLKMGMKSKANRSAGPYFRSMFDNPNENQMRLFWPKQADDTRTLRVRALYFEKTALHLAIRVSCHSRCSTSPTVFRAHFVFVRQSLPSELALRNTRSVRLWRLVFATKAKAGPS